MPGNRLRRKVSFIASGAVASQPNLAAMHGANVRARKALHVLDPHDAGVRPVPGVDRPQHLSGVVQVDIGIDHDDELHPAMRGERRLDHRFGLRVVGLVEATTQPRICPGEPISRTFASGETAFHTSVCSMRPSSAESSVPPARIT